MARLQLVAKVVMSMSSATASAWRAPRLDLVEPEVPRLTDEEIQQIKDDAYRESFDQGHREGFAAGEQAGMSEGHATGHAEGLADGLAEGLATYEARANAFLALVESVDHPISQMDEQLAIEVAELAAMIGGELARREIDQDPALLADHVLQIARALPVQQHPPDVYLHPSDKALVSAFIEGLESAHPAKSWPLFEDTSLEPGDCRMQGRDSSIDASLNQMALELIKSAIRAG